MSCAKSQSSVWWDYTDHALEEFMEFRLTYAGEVLRSLAH